MEKEIDLTLFCRTQLEGGQLGLREEVEKVHPISGLGGGLPDGCQGWRSLHDGGEEVMISGEL